MSAISNMDVTDTVESRYESTLSDSPGADRGNVTPRVVENTLDGGNFIVAGGSKEFKEHLKSIGAKWVPKSKGYVIPASKKDYVESLMKEGNVPAVTSHSSFVHVPVDAIAEPGIGSSADLPEAPTNPTGGDTTSLDETPAEPMEGEISTEGHPATTTDEIAPEIAHAETSESVLLSEHPEAPQPEDAPAVSEDSPPVAAATDTYVPTTEASAAQETPQIQQQETGNGNGTEAEPQPTAGATLDTSPGKVHLVQVNNRSIAVLGETKQEEENLLQVGAKYNKAIKVGDGKVEGWTFGRSLLSAVQKIFPGLAVQSLPKSPKEPKKVTEAKSPKAKGVTSSKPKSPKLATAKSPKTPTTTTASSSKTASPESVEGEREGEGEGSAEKRKRKRTTRAEESAAQQAYHHTHTHTQTHTQSEGQVHLQGDPQAQGDPSASAEMAGTSVVA